MSGAAWQALQSLSTVSEVTVKLLSSPPMLPESAESLLAKTAVGMSARMGPPILTQEEGIPLRRVEAVLLGAKLDDSPEEQTICGAVFLFRGDLVAVMEFPPVVITPMKPELTAHVDWAVQAYRTEIP